jgi:hypothetical protein
MIRFPNGHWAAHRPAGSRRSDMSGTRLTDFGRYCGEVQTRSGPARYLDTAGHQPAVAPGAGRGGDAGPFGGRGDDQR